MANTERTIWTIAYRKPTGPWFQRVDLELTWAQAMYLASDFGELRSELEVYYTTTKANDDAALAEWAAVGYRDGLLKDYADDAYNIMVGSGKRIKVKDTGKLDPRLTILDANQAEAKWRKNTE